MDLRNATHLDRDAARQRTDQSAVNLRSISYAAYLACSWTWCIGMFLPVLMVRDYGLAGWAVFAVPNVVGAAAMGWVLARPGLSERLVVGHRSACVAFSIVTLAFHAFFLFWMSRGAVPVIPLWASFIAIGAGTIVGVVARNRRTIDLVLAWVVLSVSFFVLARGLAHFNLDSQRGRKALHDLWFLGTVCTFGFLLCPYLDLTFHQARQHNSASGAKVAFGIGFGVLFVPMIVLTLLYEGDMVGFSGSFGLAGLTTWVALHIVAQTGFTWAAHLRALPRPRKSDALLWIGGIVLAAVGIALVSRDIEPAIVAGKYVEFDELIYRAFMGFYGLVFPAYVWICMIGRRDGPTRGDVVRWLIALLAAGPLFWRGFIEERMTWLLPGVLIVILMRWVARSRMETGYGNSNMDLQEGQDELR